MNTKQMLERAAALFEQARVILANTDASAEERAKATPLLEEAKRLKTDALQLQSIETEGAALLEELKRVDQPSPAQPTDGKKFKYWGEFLESVHAFQTQGKTDSRLTMFVDEVEPQTHTRKDMSGQTSAGGGALIPTEFRAELYAAMAESSIVRQRAQIIPMRRRQIDIPVLDQTQTLGAGNPRWFGGLSFYWAEEGAEKTASDPKFRQISLVAKKLIGFTRSSDELLDDAAISLEAFLSGPMGFAGGAAWMEDYAFLMGTGVGMPLGVINAPATLSINRDVAGDIRFDDLVRMLAAFLPSANGGEWLFSQTALPRLMKIKDDANQFIWVNAETGAPRTLLGLPYRFTEKLPALGTTGDALLADFSYYLLGDRQSPTVETTKFEAWRSDKTSWRLVHRVDGQPWLNAPLTFQDTTTQVSPFVVLSSTVS